MRVDFYVSQKEKAAFVNSCEAVISSVGSATKRATEEACRTILAESLRQVPRDTGTLASTAWYHVESAFQTGVNFTKLSNNRFVGYVGYAGAERKQFSIARRLAKGPEESQGFYDQFPRYTTKFKQFQGTHHPGGKSEPSKRAGGRGKSSASGYAGHGVANAINPKNGLPASAYAAIVHEDLSMPHPRGGKAKFLEDPVRDYAASRFRRTLMNHWKYSIEWMNFATPSGVYRSHYTQRSYIETSVVTGGTTSWKGDSL